MYTHFQARPALLRVILAAVTAASAMAASVAHADDDNIIATDRPDFVESSAVVGKGRFQIETSLAWDRTKGGGTKDRTFATPTLLRIGLGEQWELRLETDGRTTYRSNDIGAGTTSTQEGYADVSLGAKWHVQDAHGSLPAVGILAHLDMNTGTSAFRGNGLKPSLRAVAEWELPADFSLGVMPGISYDKTASGKRFAAGIFGIVVGRSWTDNLRTFIEFAAPQIARGRHGGSVMSANVGAAYLLSNSWQIDTALQRGLNRNTPDLAWTIGLSARF